MIVFLDRMGLPVLRNDSNNPPTPINAPPMPTSEKSGLAVPCTERIMGKRKMVMPATPCVMAMTMTGSLFCIWIERVKITARKLMMAKTRYQVRTEARCCHTSPTARLSGMIVERMTTMGESSTSIPKINMSKAATRMMPKAMVYAMMGSALKPSIPAET